eukprot:jgi/Bigna1/133984/aug1.23_g8692
MLGMVHRYKAECQKLKTYTRSVIEEMRKGVAEGVINMHRNAESAAVYATKPFMGDGGHDEEDESSERRRGVVLMRNILFGELPSFHAPDFRGGCK